MLKVKIELDSNIIGIIGYTWDLFANYIGFEYILVENGEDLLISNTETADIEISDAFTNNIENNEYHFSQYFKNEPLIFCANKRPDYLSTCFYIVNFLQEYVKDTTDEIGRFMYQSSFQKKFDCVTDNLVGKYFDTLFQSLPKLNNTISPRKFTSRFFLSHDNDDLYASFLQDGFYAVKNGRIDIILKLIFNEIMRKPEWLNMDKIMNIEDEYDVKSTFFWMVNKGWVDRKLVDKKIKNADYTYGSKAIQSIVNQIEQRGFENGLHKSISNESFEEEISKLGFKPLGTRTHFLRADVPNFFNTLENSGLKLDFSLGFPDHYGFRNGFNQPVKPYSINEKRIHDVIIVPLHIMDASFRTYQKLTPPEILNRTIDFFEKNKENSIFNILWHNKYFTNYKFKGFLKVYRSILDFMKQNNFGSISQRELIGLYN